MKCPVERGYWRGDSKGQIALARRNEVDTHWKGVREVGSYDKGLQKDKDEKQEGNEKDEKELFCLTISAICIVRIVDFTTSPHSLNGFSSNG